MHLEAAMLDPSSKLYHYQARVLTWVDGDTVDLEISLGLFVKVKRRARLLGVDAPEMFGAKATAAGRDAFAFVKAACPPGSTVFIRTALDEGDKYGRLLVAITTLDGRDVSEELIKAGHAVRLA